MSTMMSHVVIPGTARIDATPVQGLLPLGVEETGDLRLYRLMLPFLPPSKNVYDGWLREWQSAAKKKWVRHIVDQCEALMIPEAEKIGLAAVLVFPTVARRDPQNYSNCLWHWVPDALQKAGVIDDDREGKIEIGPNWGLKFAIDKRAAPKVQRQRTHIAITMKVKG
jgi:hypothetical protein